MRPDKTIPETASLQVFADDQLVGTLAILDNQKIAFEYSASWIKNGYSISPLSLPLKPGVFIPRSYEPFDGLFGVFADSLPDGWGSLLLDRKLRSMHIASQSLNPLQKLALIGAQGRGILEYRPSVALRESFTGLSFDEIARECANILADRPALHLDTLFEMGGSSGGARPKINVSYNDQEWIIKFPASCDPADIGMEEALYFECAEKCGIDVPEFQLFSSQTCAGYFGCARFDRTEQGKIHMISVSALLETSHRIPNLDYEDLLKLTWILCQDNKEVRRMFQLACFNVFSHNRDDHSRNFSFLYKDGRWQLSPAYDLTYSNSIGGEHATTVKGNGRNPGIQELRELAANAGISETEANEIIDQIQSVVMEDLGPLLRKKNRF